MTRASDWYVRLGLIATVFSIMFVIWAIDAVLPAAATLSFTVCSGETPRTQWGSTVTAWAGHAAGRQRTLEDKQLARRVGQCRIAQCVHAGALNRPRSQRGDERFRGAI
jgi:hypothetical protein